MTLYEDRAPKIKQAQELLDGIKTKGENPTADQVKQLEQLEADVNSIDAQIELHEKTNKVTSNLEKMYAGSNSEDAGTKTDAKPVGDHTAKQVREDGLAKLTS